MASEALRFGHGCTVHVGVDVGAEDVEVDVLYITFIMGAQYTGYLVPYNDKVQSGKCTAGKLTLCVQILDSDRGVLNKFPCEATNIYRCRLLRICDDTASMLASSHPPYLSSRQHFKLINHRSCVVPVLGAASKVAKHSQEDLLYLEL